MSYEEKLQKISKDKEFGSNDAPTFKDLLLPENERFTDAEIVIRHGKRVEELKNAMDPPVTNTMLAEICGCTSQTIADIIRGNSKSVNLSYCNKIAEYFLCSPYYVLGVTKHKYGVLIDSKEVIFPFYQGENSELPNFMRAVQWTKIDPVLFSTMDKVFHLNASSRDAIAKILKLIVKP